MNKYNLFENKNINYNEVFDEALKDVANRIYKSDIELKRKIEEIKRKRKVKCIQNKIHK
jgi:hypothetical protein